MYNDESLVLASGDCALSNETLRLLGKRASTRQFEQDNEGHSLPLSPEEEDVIIQGALRAPTAGNLLAYSIIKIVDQKIKEKLSVLCDNQAFIAKAPFALVFVADYQKWIDAFKVTHCENHADDMDTSKTMAPGEGSFMLAINDAVIAAQNAVIAAESLGIGSCYIGDVMEQGPKIAEVLNLPQHTFPAAFVVFGRSRKQLEPTEHFCSGAVMTDSYARPSEEEILQLVNEMTAWAPSSRMSQVCQTYPESVFVRKFSSSFMADMDASVAWWMKRFCTPESTDSRDTE